MGRITGWWLGASTCVSRAKLYELAVKAGGFAALEQCSRAELGLLGVDDATLARWWSIPDGSSRGEGISRADPRYPRALDLDDQAPPLLYCEGNIELLNQPVSVAIVGTRRCSGRGAALARIRDRLSV